MATPVRTDYDRAEAICEFWRWVLDTKTALEDAAKHWSPVANPEFTRSSEFVRERKASAECRLHRFLCGPIAISHNKRKPRFPRGLAGLNQAYSPDFRQAWQQSDRDVALLRAASQLQSYFNRNNIWTTHQLDAEVADQLTYEDVIALETVDLVLAATSRDETSPSPSDDPDYYAHLAGQAQHMMDAVEDQYDRDRLPLVEMANEVLIRSDDQLSTEMLIKIRGLARHLEQFGIRSK